MFVFGDFNVYNKDWLTYSCEVIHWVNSVIIFFISNNITTWLTFLPGSQTLILAVQLFWICFFLSSDASISSTMLFPLSENFDHVVVSGSIDFAGTFLRTLILMTQIYRYLFSLLVLIWGCMIFL